MLVLAAHPDDAEIGCGGTILDIVARGRRVVIVDMSRGEKGTLGDERTRAAEADAAAEMLGVHARINLGLPDAELRDDDAALRAIVAELRRWKPTVLLAHAEQDVHPDHRATGAVAKRAFFHAGLKNSMPDLGDPSRPRLLAHFAGNDLVAPTFCIDITAHVERKQEVVRCYASQVRGDDAHRVRKLDVLDRSQARDRYFGSLCGYSAAEPFVVDGPLPLGGLSPLLQGGSL